jgi:HEAT repeat protein
MRTWALVLLVLSSPSAAAQSLEERIDRAPDGEVRFSYAARPGVFGDGRHLIAWDCAAGRCRSHQIEGHTYDVDRSHWRTACDSGPVRAALTKRGTDVVRLRVYVGGAAGASPGRVTDLGTVGAPEATRYLLSLARTATPGVAEKAIFAAALADSVTLWPDLLRIARDAGVSPRTRRTAVFWVGQAADEAATRGLDALVGADTVDRAVREAAVFALSQQPRDVGVPSLIRIVRTHRDAHLRRKAMFWLAQSDDPRALALFEEIF